MINMIVMIIVGIGIGYIVLKVRERTINALRGKPFEKFDWSKFKKGMFTLLDPVEWGKTFSFLFNFRNLIIFGVVIGSIWGAGYWIGQQSKPVNLVLDYDTAAVMLVPKNAKAWHKPKDSNKPYWELENGKRKPVTISDIPLLKEALKPYGIDIKPFATIGYGTSTVHRGREVGVGTSLVKWYKYHGDVWATNRGAYIGVDYKITDNSGIIAGYGKGFKGEDRVYAGWMWKF